MNKNLHYNILLILDRKLGNCLVKFGQTKANNTRMGCGHGLVNIFHRIFNQYNLHELKSVLIVITPNGISWTPNNECR
jgi:hypothetical protein